MRGGRERWAVGGKVGGRGERGRWGERWEGEVRGGGGGKGGRER